MSEGQFWRDLQEDLEDPEFRAAFEEETRKIQAQQENQGE